MIPVVHRKASALSGLKCDLAEQAQSMPSPTFTLDARALVLPSLCSIVSLVLSAEYRALVAHFEFIWYHTLSP